MSAREPNDGPTAIGIFLLADAFLDAARDIKDGSRRKITAGPLRFLCFHAVELYFKAYLRAQGTTNKSLENMVHDLTAIIKKAAEGGLELGELEARLAKLVDARAYVQTRYRVVETKFDLTPAAAIDLTARVRARVRSALQLNRVGMPIKNS